MESPKYTVGERPKRKLTEEMVQKIQAHLDENKEKKNKGQRKQLKKPMDIYESLKAEVEKSIQELSQIHPKHISTDKIKILCAKKIETPSILDALVNISEETSEETQEITDQALRHLKLYDKLLQEAVR